jgi:formylmethanofuran dehydrogenase subunit E
MLIRYLCKGIFKFISLLGNKNYSQDNYARKQYGRSRASKNTQKNTIQDLAKCRYCGLYLPAGDAVNYNGELFCCRDHANKFS